MAALVIVPRDTNRPEIVSTVVERTPGDMRDCTSIAFFELYGALLGVQAAKKWQAATHPQTDIDLIVYAGDNAVVLSWLAAEDSQHPGAIPLLRKIYAALGRTRLYVTFVPSVDNASDEYTRCLSQHSPPEQRRFDITIRALQLAEVQAHSSWSANGAQIGARKTDRRTARSTGFSDNDDDAA
jgi:hypothetical protein